MAHTVILPTLVHSSLLLVVLLGELHEVACTHIVAKPKPLLAHARADLDMCSDLLLQFGFLHMIQDVDVHLQLDRLDMGMSRATAMLEALCQAEGINSSSSLMEAECSMSALLLPDGAPSGDVESFDK